MIPRRLGRIGTGLRIGGVLLLTAAGASADDRTTEGADLQARMHRAEAASALDGAREALIAGAYEEADRLAQSAMRTDPRYAAQAEEILTEVARRTSARPARRTQWPELPSSDQRWRDAVGASERAMTPAERRLFSIPAQERDDAPAQDLEPAWRKALREKLELPVDDMNFEPGTTFADVRRLLSARYGITIVVDHRHREKADVASVEMRVSAGMPLSDLLSLVTEQFLGLRYALKNQAVVITDAAAAAEAEAVTRIYDVEDILALMNAQKRSRERPWLENGIVDEAQVLGTGNGFVAEPGFNLEGLEGPWEAEDEVTAEDLADILEEALRR